jgi:hypothetical protein
MPASKSRTRVSFFNVGNKSREACFREFLNSLLAPAMGRPLPQLTRFMGSLHPRLHCASVRLYPDISLAWRNISSIKSVDPVNKRVRYSFPTSTPMSNVLLSDIKSPVRAQQNALSPRFSTRRETALSRSMSSYMAGHAVTNSASKRHV